MADARPETVTFPVARVLNGGFAGRDQTQVRAHIEELAHLGVKDPGETPTFYPLFKTAVTQASELEVVAPAGNWGEAEPVILFTRRRAPGDGGHPTTPTGTSRGSAS